MKNRYVKIKRITTTNSDNGEEDSTLSLNFSLLLKMLYTGS